MRKDQWGEPPVYQFAYSKITESSGSNLACAPLDHTASHACVATGRLVGCLNFGIYLINSF
jgi:hypothetical protein